MDTFKSFASSLYSTTDKSFADSALRVFRFQAERNPVYKVFLQLLGVRIENVRALNDIPFMPVSFFKNHVLKSGEWKAESVFESSGTTGSVPSVHHVADLEFYRLHAVKCFEYFFSKISDYHFLALLPSYLERQNSSLVTMMDYFIRQSGSPYSGFYLNNIAELLADIQRLKQDNKKTVVWGVTFALIDLAQTHKPDLSHCIVFETGGMKGRSKEITRNELHSILRHGFNCDRIYSEYGMTELLSQCYTRGFETFYCPPWVKIVGRDIADPLEKGLLNETAGINIIDLANWHSICFIETEDMGKVHADGSFDVLGRLDNSDIRGCNLMA